MVCLVAVGAVWIGGDGRQARTHLLVAAGLARDLYDQLEGGKPEAAQQTLALLQEQTRAARQRTGGQIWGVGRRIPLLGGNLTAIAEVATALEDLAHNGLPALVDVAAELDPDRLAPADGRVDLASLQRAGPAIHTASQAATRALEQVAAIPTNGLLPPVRSALTELRHELEKAAAGIGAAARTAALAPPMLGADGRRTYLVLFQNNAEVRATGGMPGAYAVIEADGGKVRMLHQGTASRNLRVFERPVLPLEPAMRQLYTDRPGIYPANVNLSPHFPTAAKLAREMYRLRSGRPVDGVIATDPVALSYLLRATGPVPDRNGRLLTAENVVRILLSEVPARYPSNAEQDEYYASAAATVFDALLHDSADGRAMLRELARAAGERRLQVWSTHPAEQRRIEETVLAGQLPADDQKAPVVGVFLNDGSGAKLGYYLTQSARLDTVACRPDGRRELRLRVTLGSTAPPDGLPRSVLGLGLAGDPYTIRTNVSIFAPTEGALVDAELDGAEVALGTGTERGRSVGIVTVDVAPGASRTLKVTLLTGVLPPEDSIPAELRVTPTATEWDTTVSTLACTSSG